MPPSKTKKKDNLRCAAAVLLLSEVAGRSSLTSCGDNPLGPRGMSEEDRQGLFRTVWCQWRGDGAARLFEEARHTVRGLREEWWLQATMTMQAPSSYDFTDSLDGVFAGLEEDLFAKHWNLRCYLSGFQPVPGERKPRRSRKSERWLVAKAPPGGKLFRLTDSAQARFKLMLADSRASPERLCHVLEDAWLAVQSPRE